MIASFEELHYRNKCQMAYRLSKNKNLVCGFYEEHSHKIIPVENCFLQAKPANQLIKEVNAILKNTKSHLTMKPPNKVSFVTFSSDMVFRRKKSCWFWLPMGKCFPAETMLLKIC